MEKVNISIRLPVTLHDLVERRAERDKTTKSEVIRIALLRYFVQEAGELIVGADDEKTADLQGKTRQKKGAPPRRGST